MRLKDSLLIKMWLSFMLLVAVALAFLWTVQILLFEPNYLDATTDDLIVRVEENANKIKGLETLDPNSSDNPVRFLSKTVIGIVFLVNENGDIVTAYNNGQEIEPIGLSEHYNWLISKYPEVISGNNIQNIEKFTKTTAIAIGVPTIFQDKPMALLLYNNVTQINALQSLNRHQLFVLSIVLFSTASIIALILSRYFLNPITKIKNAVTQLTKGNLAATPNVSRTDELGELSDSVSDLGNELQRVDKLRKEIISNVSHELRAPLSLITGYGEMVRDVTGNDEEKRNSNMNLIISEANRLSAMVDDIMDYSIMQAGYSTLKIEPCNFYELLLSVNDFAQRIAQQYNISIILTTLSTTIPVSIDALKINQVLRNLVNNAINHTDSGEEIQIVVEQKYGAIRVSVINPGEDIPEDKINQIWERYQRVQHQGGHKEGTGIGLAIVSTILTGHNFDFGAESSNNITNFWFSIPESENSIQRSASDIE